MSFILLFAVVVSCVVGSMAVSDPKLLQLAQANDNFGLALLHRLEQDELLSKKMVPDNVFISPFSIGTVLGMLLAGSANQTYAQIYNTLGFDPSHQFTETEILSNYKSLFHQMRDQLSGTDKQNILQVANSMALQKDFQLKDSYLKTVTENFDSRVFSEDFAHSSHQATVDINKWAAEKTHGKIEKLFNEDLDPSTVLVLLNAIYFKGEWKTKFNATKTTKATFTNAHAHTGQADTMSLEHRFNYSNFDDGQLLELPYRGDQLSMYVFLPNVASQKQYRTITGLLGHSITRGATELSTRIAKLRPWTVKVNLPRFKVEQEYGLRDWLTQLGMVDAFTHGKADLSRIDGRKDLLVSEVMHKTYVEVNEEGAEAAAVTGGVVVVESVEMPAHFNANRPFLFLIRDNIHQLTLFAGVINKA